MEIWKLSDQYPAYKFLFTTREELPIDDVDLVKNILNSSKLITASTAQHIQQLIKQNQKKKKLF